MSGNSFGKIFKLTTFGESHGSCIGGIIEGCPAGFKIDFKFKKQIGHKNTCVYIGSFFEGKGIEQIFRLAKKNSENFFHIYGEKQYLRSKKIKVPESIIGDL